MRIKFSMPWPEIVVTVVILLMDQLSKHWVKVTLPLYQPMPFIPGVLGLCYVRNSGVAFGFLSGYPWLMAILSIVGMIGLVIMYIMLFIVRNVATLPSDEEEFNGTLPQINAACRLAWTLTFGGAVGNVIDRVRYGSVVDFLYFPFVDFAIFNIADIAITCGGILMVAIYLYLEFGLKPTRNVSHE